MSKSDIFNIILLLHISYFLSCSNNITYGEDPKNGECIFEPVVKESNGEFTKSIKTSEDKYTLISIEHKNFAYTEFYQLYSPNGNLRLIASGAQEACAINGYRLDYNDDGYISNVSYIGYLENDTDLTNNYSVKTMKQWLYSSIHNKSDRDFEIKRNENNEIYSIGSIEIPINYKAKYKIAEWGPFWSSDLDGGYLGFFVLLECQDTNGSYINYLYYDNKLIAELAYWKGTFIKARTYNRLGALVKQYSDRNMDILFQTFIDYDTNSLWYTDN